MTTTLLCEGPNRIEITPAYREFARGGEKVLGLVPGGSRRETQVMPGERLKAFDLAVGAGKV